MSLLETLLELVEGVPQGVLLLDSNRRLVMANRAGRRIVEQDGLSIDRLKVLISAAARKPGRLRTMLLHHDSDRQPAIVAARAASSPKRAKPWTMLLIADPSSSIAEPDLLREIFGLTPRQAQLASLIAAGADLAEVSARLSIDYETVRSHVRELRARTNTRRQADLVRVLLFAWLIGCPVNDR